jgi:hypothetical protein
VGLRRLERKLGSCEGAIAASGRSVSNINSASELVSNWHDDQRPEILLVVGPCVEATRALGSCEDIS